MQVARLASASIAAIALAAMLGSVSASAQSATLDGVTAVPMASGELDAVKGLHIHFFTPSGIHRVNSNNVDHYFDNDGNPNNPKVGPGYHGLCRASAVSKGVSGAGPC